jgi:hypothetical protein
MGTTTHGTAKKKVKFVFQTPVAHIELLVEGADHRLTVELIRDITANAGVLTDELQKRLQQHSVFKGLQSKRDKDAVLRAKIPRKLLFTIILSAISKARQQIRVSPLIGWPGLNTCATRLLSVEDSTTDVDQSKAPGQGRGSRVNYPRERRSNGKRARKEQAANNT